VHQIAGLLFVQKVDRPLECRPERLLTGRKITRPSRQEREARVEPTEELGRGERASAAGAELDRERQAVEASADLADCLLVGEVGSEVWIGP